MSEVISFNDPLYPKQLKSINDAPEKIYFKGEWDEKMFQNCIGVVGSRKMSIYGKKVTQLIVSHMVSAGYTIVSGFMSGVDSEAHKACLEGRGKTIAVMPCGVDIIHPETNYHLYQQIIEERSLFVSEFPDGHSPAKWTYPRRNRIIAGLVSKLVVVEAALGSGSMITASFAKKYDREVFAVPGSLFSATSSGTHQLIKEGSKIVCNVYDIIGQICVTNPPIVGEDLGSTEENILSILSQDKYDLNELLQYIGHVNISQLSVILTNLQIKGLIFEEEGKFYAR